MMRPFIVGVMGSGQVGPETTAYQQAHQVGQLIAEQGAVMLCGGGGGVMAAAMQGARAGKTIAVLKGRTAPTGVPAGFILASGLQDGRNYVNAALSDVLIALQGGPGTLSEIALALKIGTPVVCLGYWGFLIDFATADKGLWPTGRLVRATTPAAAVAGGLALARQRYGETGPVTATAAPLPDPGIPFLADEIAALKKYVGDW